MKIPNIRLQNQQLLNPLFCQPKELVSWLGAMQAQNYSMVKWAVGMRLKSATIQTVEEALRKGEILRTHVMRPTMASCSGRGYSLDAEVVCPAHQVG